jgi:hypothetical protein
MDQERRERLTQYYSADPKTLPDKEIKPLKYSKIDKFANNLEINLDLAANAVKSYIDGAELISPQMKQIIENQKKLMPRNYQNFYYKRRDSYSYSGSNYSNQVASQIAAQIAKTLVVPSNSFFQEGGGDFGRILSNPEAATSLYTQEVIAAEEEDVKIVETESFKLRRGGTEGRGGRCSQRGRLKTFSHQ